MKKLFTNDKFFLTVFLVSVIGVVISTVTALITNPDTYFNVSIIYILMVFCQVGIYISYKKHSKNIMKGLMGAIFMALLISSIIWKISNRSEIPFHIIDIVFSFGIVLNHFVINSDHMSSPLQIAINQIAATVLAINSIIWAITFFNYCSSVIEFILSIATALGYCCSILFLVCIESRLDAYRLDREKAGWTEEKGYPEGYIHESQKK